jgi:hypothetical protein
MADSIKDWLENLGLANYSDVFESNNVGVDVLAGNCSPACQLHWYEHRISCQACANGSESAKTAQIAGCDD